MSEIKLYIFDMNGTLCNTPFIDHQPLAILPGRSEKLAELRKAGAKLAIATNQGGVAFGFQTEEEAYEEVRGVQRPLHIDYYAISFGHPKPKWGYDQYGTKEMLAMRKPEPGMLNLLIKQAGVQAAETMMIGDRDEDFEAARRAECVFMWADDFFGSAQERLWHIYGLYLGACEILKEQVPLLILEKDGSGSIGWGGYSWTNWSNMDEAAQVIGVAIQQEKARQEEAFDPFLDE